MKILTIGLDGGDRRIIQAMPMPFVHKLLEQHVCLDVEEDLWSRGWAKMLCGKPGHESGAYYNKLLLDDSHNTTQRFNIEDYTKNQNIEPLWTRLNKENHDVGFMSLPTTIPAPVVNGFFISGAGGGHHPKDGLPEVACYPPNIHKTLNEDGQYVWERRLHKGLEKDFSVFIEDLIKAVTIRTDKFLYLCKKYKTDYSFIMHKATTVVQNIAMSEIEKLIDYNCVPANLVQEKIVRFFNIMDKQIESLINELNPEHVMLVSDHGQSPRKYSVNVNDWLLKTGWQVKPAKNVDVVKKTLKTIAGFLPSGLKTIISGTVPEVRTKISDMRGMNVDWQKTFAFGIRYIPGIYINDNIRFSGPVDSNQNASELVQKIIEQFNASTQAIEHNFKAYAYRRNYVNSRYERLLPDIWIDHSDTYFFEQHGQFVSPNNDYGPIENLENVNRDMFTGIKGRHPLLCVDPFLADLVEENDELDLTLVYKLIVRGMNT